MNGHGNLNNNYCCGASDFLQQGRQVAMMTPFNQGIPPAQVPPVQIPPTHFPPAQFPPGQVPPIGNRPMMPEPGKTTTPAPIPMPMPMPQLNIPTTLSSDDYLAGLLRNYIGQRVYVEFLIGTTGPLIDRLGELVQVGTNYIMIQPSDTDDLQVCDLYSIKFVTILR